MSERFSMFGPKKNRVFTGTEEGDDFSVDLNLTPLMDVMSNILFFLLAGFGAAIISFLAASVPVQADSDTPPEPPPSDKVTLNLQITPDGYRISASNEKLAPEVLAKLKQEIKRTELGYDNASLAQAALQIKTQYPASDTVIIVPSDSTVYAEIVAVMEATKDIQHENKRVKMFSKVVVADLVRADTVPEGAAQ